MKQILKMALLGATALSICFIARAHATSVTKTETVVLAVGLSGGVEEGRGLLKEDAEIKVWPFISVPPSLHTYSCNILLLQS